MNPDPEELAAWLRLTASQALAPAQWREALRTWGEPGAVLAAGRSRVASVIGTDAARILFGTPDDTLAQAIAAATRWCSEPGHHCITLADARYPPLLLEIPDPPALLFASGAIDLLARPGVALLVPATPSREGLMNARQFARALAQHHIELVCPAARGFLAPADWLGSTAAAAPIILCAQASGASDSAAHSAPSIGAAPTDTSTLCISLEVPGVVAPRQRRIVAERLTIGVARAVLVIEAAVGSNAMSSARLAAECGRDVMAIPGSIHSPLSKGCHRLIRDGARLVETIDDVLDELRRSTPLRS